MANPVDLEALEFVRQKTGLIIKTFAASADDVRKAINQQYRQEIVGEVGEALKQTEEELLKIPTIDSRQIAEIIKEAPIAKIVSTILEYAVSSRASMFISNHRKIELEYVIESTVFYMIS